MSFLCCMCLYLFILMISCFRSVRFRRVSARILKWYCWVWKLCIFMKVWGFWRFCSYYWVVFYFICMLNCRWEILLLKLMVFSLILSSCFCRICFAVKLGCKFYLKLLNCCGWSRSEKMRRICKRWKSCVWCSRWWVVVWVWCCFNSAARVLRRRRFGIRIWRVWFVSTLF